MRTSRFLARAVAIGALAATLPLAVYAAQSWKQNFAKDSASPLSDVRRKACASVNPNEKEGVQALLNVLTTMQVARVDWFVRDGAIEALSNLSDEKAKGVIAKALEKLEKDEKKQKGVATGPMPTPRSLIKEALVLAYGRQRSPSHLDEVTAALDDPHPAVRRAAARALTKLRDKKGVAALVARFEKEPPADNYREVCVIHEALLDLTGRKLGRDAKQWKEWWAAAEAAFKLPEQMTEEEKKAVEEEEAKREKEGEDAKKTVVRGVPLTYTERGKGVPLLVLHDDSWKDAYLQPYIASIYDTCRVIFIKLPEVDEFDEKNVKIKKNIGGMPYYPVDALVDAFEELRKERKYEKFALMAHGFTSLIAQRYLTRYPEHVSHLIMIGGLSGDAAYGNILDGIEVEANKTHDVEMQHMQKNHLIIDEKSNKKEYEPKDDAEELVLERKAFTMYFANPQDPEIGAIFEKCMKPLDRKESISPDFDTSREKKPPIPVLVMVGAKSLWCQVGDAQRIAKNYPRGECVVFENSGMMPFIEENAKFTQTVKDFFKRNPGGK